ncbi:MAG: hypothetical protein KME17_14135 [Cyanosarcina radialis HA8281-LM2]|nr:hypothetical protein [Cyanosarcina radialis HA8281-LM2]
MGRWGDGGMGRARGREGERETLLTSHSTLHTPYSTLNTSKASELLNS